MGRRVVLSTGREAEVTDEQYDALVRSGEVQGELTTEEMARRGRTAEKTKYDTEGDPLGRAATFGVGVASGVTGGLTPLSARALGSDLVPGLAEDNPTTFGLGEAAGVVLGASLGARAGGSGIAGGLPGVASAAGGRATAALGGGRLARLAGGAVEGAIGGVGTAVSHASVSNDPVTIESAIADVGLGALLNAGFGALGRGVTKTGERLGAKIAREDAEIAAREAAEEMAEGMAPRYEALRVQVKNHAAAAAKRADDGVRAAERVLDEAAEALRDIPGKVIRSAQNAADANLERMGVLYRHSGAGAEFSDILIRSRSAMEKAVKAGDADAAVDLANDLGKRAAVKHMEIGGVDVPGLGPLPQAGYKVDVPRMSVVMEDASHAMDSAKQGVKAARGASVAAAVELPDSLGAFAKLQPESLAQLEMLASKNPAIRRAMEDMLEEGGRQADGSLSVAVRDLANSVGALRRTTGSGGGAQRASWLSRAVKGGVRHGAGRAADRAVGGGFKGGIARSVVAGGAGALLGGVPGLFVAAEVSGARAAVMGRVRRAVASIAPRTGRAIQKASPALTRLMTAPDGTREKGTPQEIALRRFDETARNAVGAPDATFEAVRHVIPAGVDAAAGIQHKAIAITNYLASVMPKDPGTAQAQLKSFWKPSNEQIQKFASQHLAATDPLAAIDYLAEGNIDLDMATSLRQNYPALFEEFRREFMQALPSKGDMPHGQLMAYTVMLGLPMHGLQTPENIAYFQTEVHGPKSDGPEPSTPPTFSPGAPPARSSSGSPQPGMMTQAQRLQNR